MVERKHEWVRRSLRDELSAAPAHSPLPTERELAERFEVSRATIRAAIAGLRDAGLIYQVQGAGTFTAEAAIVKTLALSSFSEDMAERHLRPSSQLLDGDTHGADADTAAKLRLSPGDTVLRLRRLRLADEAPMCLETVRLSAARFPALFEHDLTASLYQLLDETYRTRLVRADQTVRATVVEPEQAELLRVAPFSPALLVERVGIDQRERPTEHTVSLYRADRYELSFSARRERS